MKFEQLPKGKLVMVECKAYAYNIIHDSEEKMGVVHFEILVEDDRKAPQGSTPAEKATIEKETG